MIILQRKKYLDKERSDIFIFVNTVVLKFGRELTAGIETIFTLQFN